MSHVRRCEIHGRRTPERWAKIGCRCCTDQGFGSRSKWYCSRVQAICAHDLGDIRGLRGVGGCGNRRYRASADFQSDAVSGNRVGRGRERTCIECTAGSIGPCIIREQRRRERGGSNDRRRRRRPAESPRRMETHREYSSRSQQTARRRARTGRLGVSGRGWRARAAVPREESTAANTSDGRESSTAIVGSERETGGHPLSPLGGRCARRETGQKAASQRTQLSEGREGEREGPARGESSRWWRCESESPRAHTSCERAAVDRAGMDRASPCQHTRRLGPRRVMQEAPSLDRHMYKVVYGWCKCATVGGGRVLCEFLCMLITVCYQRCIATTLCWAFEAEKSGLRGIAIRAIVHAAETGNRYVSYVDGMQPLSACTRQADYIPQGAVDGHMYSATTRSSTSLTIYLRTRFSLNDTINRFFCLSSQPVNLHTHGLGSPCFT